MKPPDRDELIAAYVNAWGAAQSLIFSMILGAYVGVRMAAIRETLANGALLALVCVLHSVVIFATGLPFVRFGIGGSCLQPPIVVLITAAIIIESFFWKMLFGSLLFYFCIMISWLLVTAITSAALSLTFLTGDKS